MDFYPLTENNDFAISVVVLVNCGKTSLKSLGKPGKNLCHRVITMTNSNNIKFQYQYRKRSPLGSIFGDTHLKEIMKPSKAQTSLGFFPIREQH